MLVYVPLFDRRSTFEIYQVMNLPISYPRIEQKSEIIAKCKIATKFIAPNLTRTRFMLLTSKEAKRCKTDALGTYSVASSIYVAGNYRVYSNCLEETKKELRAVAK